MTDKAEKSGNFTLSGPSWVLLVILAGGSVGVGSEFVPGWLGKEKTVSLSADSSKKIDKLSAKVEALTRQLGKVSTDLDQVTGDFGDISKLTSRMDRIASHLAAVDRRVGRLESEGLGR